MTDVEPHRYEAEARERWGETDAYKESARRTKQYGAADWAPIKEERAEGLATYVAEAIKANAVRRAD